MSVLCESPSHEPIALLVLYYVYRVFRRPGGWCVEHLHSRADVVLAWAASPEFVVILSKSQFSCFKGVYRLMGGAACVFVRSRRAAFPPPKKTLFSLLLLLLHTRILLESDVCLLWSCFSLFFFLFRWPGGGRGGDDFLVFVLRPSFILRGS